MVRTLFASILLTLVIASGVSTQSPVPAYVIVGDSIEFGLGDDIAADGFGYPPIVAAFLTTFLGRAPAVHNSGTPFATTRDIWRDQVPEAIAAAAGHAPVVVSWGGGGNDLADVVTGPQAAACREVQSCLGRLNGLLNETEQTIDRTIRQLRAALGPDAVILMRTQYNALLRAGCPNQQAAAVGTAALEGAPGTVLDRGLNDRIRSVAAKYGAQVVDVFPAFAINANTLVAADCIHPSGAGYQVIAALSNAAFLAAQ
jgi:lysophospholipase L1-like esterase